MLNAKTNQKNPAKSTFPFACLTLFTHNIYIYHTVKSIHVRKCHNRTKKTTAGENVDLRVVMLVEVLNVILDGRAELRRIDGEDMTGPSPF